jgi:hypothetical protein
MICYVSMVVTLMQFLNGEFPNAPCDTNSTKIVVYKFSPNLDDYVSSSESPLSRSDHSLQEKLARKQALNSQF